MRLRHMALRLLALGCVCAGFMLLQAQSGSAPQVIEAQGDVKFTHDPSIIKEGGTWYVFSTGSGPEHKGQLPVRCSDDLHHWKFCGTVFEQVPEWIKKASPETKDLWAPDISYFKGEYHLYYAFSLFGKNTSGIALATNKTLNASSPKFHWEDRGLILSSGASDDFNAIDPNLILDDHGHPWLAFGSFWSGIKMRRLDDKGEKTSTKDTKLYSLASRHRPEDAAAARPNLPPDWQAIEAPFIVHHDGYYYLFVSFDMCCRGTKSTYKTMVGRSREITGPYADADGKAMMDGGGTPLLTGNPRWIGPGGESVLQQKDGDIIVFHAYDGKTGVPYLQISRIAWSDGWPHAALQSEGEAGH